ncbi:hypothetical protein PENANT_c015G00574 [Penicillium antarcticum]|uniref:FAD-binding PCMH-type domain-containing protein n=1 Tax=Penicillium antarcticum TaxID=416450 RepID=A0A1V6Q411_9EURO|nr:hypothetical protein PENANT_c015G00574 [Penicillium antarcticum]
MSVQIACLGWLSILIAVFGKASGLSVPSSSTSRCRCMPQDTCWPSDHEWDKFNKNIDGKLIATNPIASPCHIDSFARYNETKCASLRSDWGLPETHYKTSSSIMASTYTNNSCNPFLPKEAPFKARDASDVQKAMHFAKRHNIRLVIRNTGHDLFGRSTGAGALGIWMHHMKDISIVDYNSSHYTSKAMKMGAGVQSFEASAAASRAGLVIVTGNCPTVGLAGGYSQGGGHGQLVSQFGLAADQVLEWEVVLADGKLVIASLTENSDLYWALSGGGGGTYGIVISMTSKAYPELRTVSGNLSFTDTGISRETFFKAVEIFTSILPSIGDAGGASIWWLINNTMSTTPTAIPRGTVALYNSLFDPLLTFFKKNNMQYTYYVEEFPTFNNAYQKMKPSENITDALLGGRYIPRTVVEQNLAGLVSSFRAIVEKDATFLISGTTVNASRVAYPDNGVNPAWRDAIINILIGGSFNYTDRNTNTVRQQVITDALLPLLEKLAPGGA